MVSKSAAIRVAISAAAALAAAVVSVAFRLVIDAGTGFLAAGSFEQAAPLWRLMLPVAGTSLVVLTLLLFGAAPIAAGVTHVLRRLAEDLASLPVVNAAYQFCAGAIVLMFGMSLGREGPAIHLGATTGATVGRLTPGADIRVLAAIGVAASIAAAFNTPVAAVFLVYEVVLRRYDLKLLPFLAGGAGIGAIVGWSIYGAAPALATPSYSWQLDYEWIAIACCGVFSAAYAAAFIHLVGALMRASRRTKWWVPKLAAALVVGLCGLAVPQVLGIGYDVTHRTLLGEYAIGTLAALVALKLVATSASVASGLPGGLIGPTFVMGGAGGALIGRAAAPFFAAPIAHPGFYGSLGMAAMLAATLRAPFTALFAVCELTGNVRAALPAAVAILVSLATVLLFFKSESIFDVQRTGSCSGAER